MLEKLRPDRDLQCYFFRPSAIAALSAASETGFTISGSWRQQFDWAVLEWNRDNVFEHPAFRYLPDGDLSGLTLTYDETRENCVPPDSDLFPTVDWPYLRVWAGPSDRIYWVPLMDHATAIEGAYACATAEIELLGTITAGEYVGFRFLGEHHTYQCYATDTLSSVMDSLVLSVETFSKWCRAERVGSKIRLTYVGNSAGERDDPAVSKTGTSGNRVGLYTYVTTGGTTSWSAETVLFTGGTSPTKWRYSLNFGNLLDRDGVTVVPTTAVRKLRWTYAADLQRGSYVRSEFGAVISNWQVSGSNRLYKVAGPGSQRFEVDAPEVSFSGTWHLQKGNYSGGSLKLSIEPQASVSCTYTCGEPHILYLGARYTASSGAVEVRVDGQLRMAESLALRGEDVLVRRPIGQFSAGTHTVVAKHTGAAEEYFYFDFFEAAIPTAQLPTFPIEPKITLATDWDTDHSLPLAPERTAWMIHSLGFHGRHNLYVGALIFYEMYRKNHSYASKVVTFDGVPEANAITSLTLVRDDYGPETAITLQHVNLIADTASTIARAFELELNRGYTGIRAEASGNVLTIYSRTMGVDGNHWTVVGTPSAGVFRVDVAGPNEKFSGGVDGNWRTDLTSLPRINRACRDWCRSFLIAMQGYGIQVCSAFSTELQDGDPDLDVGIAQRYPDNTAVLLNTPAIQCNFSPEAVAYWKEVFRGMADIHQEVGMLPYLQFGEVQWWYFPKRVNNVEVGMPLYDAYTKQQFEARYGRPMAVILNDHVNPALHPEEVQFVQDLVGKYTEQIMDYVRQTHPTAKFEVLYPTDVNEGQLNQVINYPVNYWTPAALDNLKTENFIYTGDRRLEDAMRRSCDFGEALGFSPSKRSHLVGMMDPYTAWLKEVRYAEGKNQDSVVLWALDQFCLIGYRLPLERGGTRSGMMS
jgi:hypothetical protein